MTRITPLRWASGLLVTASLALAPAAFRAGAEPVQGAAAPPKADTVAVKAPVFPRGDAALGKKIFASKCVQCHKADGSGGIKLTGNPTPSWREAKRMADPQYSDAYLRDCITNGKIKSGMIAWSKAGVKPVEIEHLIAHIRTFAKK